jgi:hypothetical protein
MTNIPVYIPSPKPAENPADKNPFPADFVGRSGECCGLKIRPPCAADWEILKKYSSPLLRKIAELEKPHKSRQAVPVNGDEAYLMIYQFCSEYVDVGHKLRSSPIYTLVEDGRALSRDRIRQQDFDRVILTIGEVFMENYLGAIRPDYKGFPPVPRVSASTVL